MGKFILGLIIGLLVIPACVYVYFRTGMAPVATEAQAMPFEKRLGRMGLHARLDKEAPKDAPFQGDEAGYLAGAQLYRRDCAVCHGLPGQPPTPVANGMFPKPPQLFRAGGHGVTDDPVGETYWIAANGIRMTGMPAYKKALSDQELWQVALMLKNADKLPDSARQELAKPPLAEGVSQPAAPATATRK